MAKPKRPRDANQLAKLIVDISTGETPGSEGDEKTLALGLVRRKAGISGARARSKALTPSQRSEIASLAAQSRWKKRGN